MAPKAPLPSGTVTLLFTDIEGSTQHWERQRVAMPEALRRHDELTRTAIERHGGYVFKTIGDAFCASFARASDAVAAAADAQRALAAEDWSAVGELVVRMALHSGATDERDGDYFGPAVNRVARLLAVAHGGQVVASNATAELLRGVMPEQAELRDLGEHRLKDLGEPERVWQLVAPGLTETFPPVRSLDSLPNNLPRQVTPLVGRADALVEVESLVFEHPLLTLLGSGGVGKTRLALQVGADLLDGSPDGVWLCELATLRDPGSVLNTVASMFGLREREKRSMLDVLVEHLRTRRLLLILDNCEHLIEEVAKIAGAILRAAPHVRILATSREPLRIAAEHVYRVPSLTVPSGGSLTHDTALQYGALALFADRALAADGRFSLSEEGIPFVVEICRRLDGIPLAIELAAARIKVLSPEQLARRLDERFRILTGGDRSALPRHQTMRAAIDWSYDLLAERERSLFRKLAIFAGGFTLEGASAVCVDEPGDELAVLDGLSSLVDKSLVQTDPGIPGRYRLLESTHQYAREKLADSGELGESANRHLSYLTELFRRAGDAYEATLSTAVNRELTLELEDARAALDWGRQNNVSKAADLFLATHLWVHLGLHREGIERANSLIAVVAEGDAHRLARLWARVSLLAIRIGHYAVARDASEEALRYARGSNDAETLSDCLIGYADIMAHFRRFDEAEAALDEAEANGKATPRRRTQTLQVRGVVASIRGDLEMTARCFAELRDSYRAINFDAGIVSATINLAEVEHARGATSKAVEIAVLEVARAEHLPNRSDWAFLLRNLAGYLNATGDVSGGRDAASKAIAFYAAQDPGGPFTAIALEHLALSMAIDGEFTSAATLEGYVQKTLEQLGFEREYTERASHERLLEILRLNVAERELSELISDGRRLQASEALATARLAAPASSYGT